MKTYTFAHGETILTIEAGSYDQALENLIFEVGEAEAAEFIYWGE
jgi:hypothetical protein